MRSRAWGISTALMMVVMAAQVEAGVLFFNGFETDTSGWFSPTRVASGTGGITSSSGSFHATTAASAGDFTRWGGYNFGAATSPFQEYWTAADIYLDVSGGWANDTRFDFTSAINDTAGSHLRDFAFNAGFYADTDNDSPGGGTNRFIVSASNNTGRANSFPKNPGRDPFAISTSGWYTFQHHFYDNGGVLAVDLSIFDSATNLLVHSWTLSNVSDVIGGVGGNRYGWFPNNEFSTLAIDDSELRVADVAAVPEPTSIALFGLGGLGLICGRIRRNKQFG